MTDSALHRFAQRRAAAADQLDALAQAAGDAGLPEVAAHLGRTAARARAGRFVVLLVGCFSSGKSTLLNALLGQPVLPVKVNPCTAILTELVFGETPSVRVQFVDGRDADVLTPDAFLERYQLRTASTEDAGAEVDDRFGAVDRAVVQWPLPLLHDGVVLLDTPGLDDDEARTRRTLASLPDADAVIFVLNATRFLTELERRTLRRELLPLGLTNLFFPVTMVDLLDALSDDPARDLADLRARAAEALAPLCEVDGVAQLDRRVFELNARGALQARWDRQAGARLEPEHAAGLAASGLAAFEQSLERFLIEERGQAQLRHLLGQAERARLDVERQAAVDRATASASVEDLRERLETLRPRFEELSWIADRVADTVDAFVARQQVRVWQSLRDLLARTEAELPDAVADFDLGTLAGLDLLTPRGRARVEQALQEQLEVWLDARIAAWQADLRPQLESALDGLRVELAGQAQDFDALARQIVTDFAGEAVHLELPHDDTEPDAVERWFSVALGAVLLSPGTMAAGWSQGYEGALKGAATRIAARLGLFALGLVLGPVGWVGLVLYVATDAALLVLTGGGQLRRLRKHVAQELRGKLVAQADAARDTVESQVAEGLAPVRDGLVRAAHDEAQAVQALVDQTLAAREQAVADAEGRAARWAVAAQAFEQGVAALQDIVGEGA